MNDINIKQANHIAAKHRMEAFLGEGAADAYHPQDLTGNMAQKPEVTEEHRLAAQQRQHKFVGG